MKTLKDLLLHELTDIYDAEKRLARGLPEIEKAAVAERLKRVLRKHIKETDNHVAKLETVFQHFGAKATGRSCAATFGLIAEAEDVAVTFKGSPALDAALICAMQKIEHYEIAAYGCLHEWSELLGNPPATALLLEILEEEKTANEALTQLARARSNEEANVEDAADDKGSDAVRAKAVVE